MHKTMKENTKGISLLPPKSKQPISLQVRQIIYSYVTMSQLIMKISKLSKNDREALVTSKILSTNKVL